MNSYVARQPIFDKNMNVYGYELLYRNSEESDSFDGTNADTSSAQTITNFHNIGFEKLTGGKRGFINFTENLIHSGIAAIMPSDVLVIELLEDIIPNDELIDACNELKRKGYLLALDDFEYSEVFDKLIEVADIIKIDFLLSSLEEIEKIIEKVDFGKTKLLAEKIETKELFDWAVSKGFTYFQGYFFAKPTIITGKAMEPLELNYMQLVRYVHKQGDNIDYTKMANVIKQDVALTFKLLKLVNSAYFGLRNNVKSVKHALAVLGTDECKKWISIVALMGFSDEKPDELTRMSLIRGRFLESLEPMMDSRDEDSDLLFMIGLFSLIDVILDIKMEDVLEQLNISSIIYETLVMKTGKCHELLLLAMAYERGDWDGAAEIALRLNLDIDELNRLYVEAITWCSSLIM